MLGIICSVLFIGCVIYYNWVETDNNVLQITRNVFIAVGFCIICALPIGQWMTEERVVDVDKAGRMIYVTPCEHYAKGGEQRGCMTPVQTSLIAYCLSEDDHQIYYCDICHTRKEAVEYYLASR